MMFTVMVLNQFEFAGMDGKKIASPVGMPKNHFRRDVEGPRTSVPIIIKSRSHVEKE